MAFLWLSVYRSRFKSIFCSDAVIDTCGFKPYCFRKFNNYLYYATQSVQVSIKSKRKLVIALVGLGTGVITGSIYSYYKFINVKAIPDNQSQITSKIIKSLPDVQISKSVINSGDTSGLKVLLFQYKSCPFCRKVRNFLDHHGISYDVVEVNPDMKEQILWSDYKKVPILLLKVEDGYLMGEFVLSKCEVNQIYLKTFAMWTIGKRHLRKRENDFNEFVHIDWQENFILQIHL